MPDPSKYTPSYDFSAFQGTQPQTPLPAVQLDVQLADIEQSTTELREAVKDIRNPDGTLRDGSVTMDSLCRPHRPGRRCDGRPRQCSAECP